MNWRGSCAPLPQTSRSASLGSGVHYTSSLWTSKERYGTSHDRGVARARLRRRRRGVYCRAYRVNSGREPRTLRTYVEPRHDDRPTRTTISGTDRLRAARSGASPGRQRSVPAPHPPTSVPTSLASLYQLLLLLLMTCAPSRHRVIICTTANSAQ